MRDDEYTSRRQTISPVGVVIDSPNVQGNMKGIERNVDLDALVDQGDRHLGRDGRCWRCDTSLRVRLAGKRRRLPG